MKEAGALFGRDAGAVVRDFKDHVAIGGIAGAELDAALAVLGFEGLEGVD